MRRKDREITEIGNIIDVINRCKVFRLAMSCQDIPYIVPLNFGYSYDNNKFEFYFHCAKEGKKLDIIRNNPVVCFEMDCDHQLVFAELPCAYGYRYQSVIGRGRVQIVDNCDEKKLFLKRLMAHQTGKLFDFKEEQVRSVAICKIEVTDISAKARNDN